MVSTTVLLEYEPTIRACEARSAELATRARDHFQAQWISTPAGTPSKKRTLVFLHLSSYNDGGNVDTTSFLLRNSFEQVLCCSPSQDSGQAPPRSDLQWLP